MPLPHNDRRRRLMARSETAGNDAGNSTRRRRPAQRGIAAAKLVGRASRPAAGFQTGLSRQECRPQARTLAPRRARESPRAAKKLVNSSTEGSVQIRRYHRTRTVMPISRTRVPSIGESASGRMLVIRPVPGTEMLLIGGLNVGWLKTLAIEATYSSLKRPHKLLPNLPAGGPPLPEPSRPGLPGLAGRADCRRCAAGGESPGVGARRKGPRPCGAAGSRPTLVHETGRHPGPSVRS